MDERFDRGNGFASRSVYTLPFTLRIFNTTFISVKILSNHGITLGVSPH